MVDINDLDAIPPLDIEVAPPEEYVSGSLPNLVPAGYYNLCITDWGWSRNRQTNEIDGKAAVLQLVVADGEHEGTAIRNIRVWTATFDRKGKRASGLGDLINAIDDHARWTNLQEATAILNKAMDERTIFRLRLDWEAFDMDFFNEQGGATMLRKSPEEKELRKKATVKGMANFKLAADGSYLPEVEGPSGAILEARYTIASFVSASRRARAR